MVSGSSLSRWQVERELWELLDVVARLPFRPGLPSSLSLPLPFRLFDLRLSLRPSVEGSGVKSAALLLLLLLPPTETITIDVGEPAVLPERACACRFFRGEMWKGLENECRNTLESGIVLVVV
jgi:hypothetical protein